MILVALLVGWLVYFSVLLIEEHLNEKRRIERRIERLRWSSLEVFKGKVSSKKMTNIFRIKNQMINWDSKPIKLLSLLGTMAAVIFEYRYPSFISKIILFGVAVVFSGRFIYLIKKRQKEERIRLELPGVLDLMVICLGSGLGLNAAFEKVGRELDESPFGIELRRMLNELKTGMPIEDALKNLAIRTNVQEISSMAGHILQSQKIGSSVLETFQILSMSLRERYKLKIKEKLMKIPVLVLLPMALFILPVIFLVVGGPAFVTIMSHNFLNP